MYKNSQTDWLNSLVIAGLGAGVITSFAVGQGQNPFIALGITAIAAVAAVTIDSLL
jgi:energy-converting hydrogenase Eha subunit G